MASTDQLSLPGFEAPPRATDRLFFAVLPDAVAAARIAALARGARAEHRLRGRGIALERLHVTLHMLGDHTGLPQILVDAARAAAAAASLGAAPFSVEFDRIGSFIGKPRNRPFVLRATRDANAALASFHRTLAAAMATVGLGTLARPAFTPHVTLLYDDRSVAEQQVEPIGWQVRELVLVHSLLGQTTHIPIACWPFGG